MTLSDEGGPASPPGPGEREAGAGNPARPSGRRERWAWHLAYPGLGAGALAGQTVLFREYLVSYDGNELGAGFFLSSWLLWVGAGALVALALLRRPGFARSFPSLLALYAPALLVALFLVRGLRSIAGVAPTDIFPSGTLALLTLLANAPVSFLTGLLFPLAAASAHAETGRAVSTVYVLESLGAFAGGAGVSVLLLAGRSPLPALPAVSVLLAAAGLALTLGRNRIGAAAHGLVLAGALALLLTPLCGRLADLLDRIQWNSRYPAADLLGTADTPHGRIAAGEIGGQRIAVANGQILAAVPGGESARAEAALLAVQPARAGRAVLLGAGSLALARELLAFPFTEVLLLVPDRAGFEFLAARLPGAVPGDPRFAVRFGDPLRTAPASGVDLFVADVGDPDTALAARWFTGEFYRFVRERLAPGGVFATAITSAENYHGSEIRRYGASVFATLASVFPFVEVTPGERAFFLAAAEPDRLAVHPDVVEDRLLGIPVSERRFEPERAATILEPRRVEYVRGIYAGEAGSPPGFVSTADRPVVYLLNLLVLGKREGSSFSKGVLALRAAGLGVLLLPLGVVLAVRFRYVLCRPGSARAGAFAAGFILAAVGAAAIALDLVLLLSYQSRYGLLFERVGLAHGLLMLGLAAGGLVGRRLPMSAVTVGAGLFALALPPLLDAGGGEAAHLALFLAAGLFCGAPFTAAAARLGRSGAGGGTAGGLLEAADHFGGAAGALLAGVLLVPLFGAAATARFAGLLVLSGPLLLLLEAGAGRLAAGPLARLGARHPTFPFVRLGFTLLALVGAAALLSAPVRREMDRPITELSPERLREALPADRHETVRAPFLRHDGFLEGEPEPTGHALATAAAVTGVTGYGGPLNILLALARDGTIRRVALLESKETPTYIGELPAFLARMEGAGASRDFRLVARGEEAGPHDLVKITGATVSCRAAVETVNRAKNRLLSEVLGRPAPAVAAAGGPALDTHSIALLAAFALCVPVFLRGGDRSRLLFLAAVFAVLGVWLNQQLSLGAVLDLLGLSLPPAGNLPLLLLVGGALLLGVLFGQVYCGWLCPFGAAQEFLGRLGLRRRPSPDFDRRARFLKHVVLAIAAVSFLLFGAERVTAFDPLEAAFSLKAPPAMWALIGVVLLASVFFFRFWCRYLCPVGAFLS
ncbi:MAG: 4Fe-4S binding protein, partial [Planctomycetes bacterium]|nr:4Fe-4S binding protein [Planctomycetota bacterium]